MTRDLSARRLHVGFSPWLCLVAIAGMLCASRPATSHGQESPAAPPREDFTAEQITFFQQHVAPILQEKCWKCHGVEHQRGELRLDGRELILQGGEQGSAIDPTDASKSLLLQAIRYETLEMPPDGKLTEEEIATLTRWVEQRLPWTPGDIPAPAKAPENVPGGARHGAPSIEEGRAHWSYQPRRTVQRPHVHDAAWGRNPIDVWIAARLETEQIPPNPPADRAVLLRRVSLDLCGLPPTLQQVEAFIGDRRPDAYERIVDRLLASPQYGEKWGRHWLDVVRYAETNGYERDGPKENVWRYRDYVIRAFNQDTPYDRFVMEQLAGDELPDRTHDSLIATGYYRLGIWDDEPVDADQAYYDSLDDVLATTSFAFMGTSMGCARCHDHKIDPFPQRDYYRLLGYFHNILQDSRQGAFKKSAFTLNTQTVVATEAERREHAVLRQQLDERRRALRSGLDQFEQEIFASLSNPEKEDARDERVRQQLLHQRAEAVLGSERAHEYEQLTRRWQELEQTQLPPLPQALTVRENGATPRDTFVLIRGSARAPGDQVTPGFPEVLPQYELASMSMPTGIESSGGRLTVARWLTDPRHPLTARVIVNRLWQHHFGRGLVATANDFGHQGEAPTHPELLDDLAEMLIHDGWQLKPLQRLIVTSQAYRMASTDQPTGLTKDPENRWLWRNNMRRLTAEEIRDTILSATGQLNLQMGGPSVYTAIPDEVLQTASRPDAAWGHSSPADRARRSVYVHVKRSIADPVLRGFDAADTDGSCPVRFATTVPTQALTSLNGQFFQEQARVLADSLRAEVGNDPRAQAARGIERTLARRATNNELARSVELMRGWREHDGVSEHDALRFLCLLYLNLNETVFVP